MEKNTNTPTEVDLLENIWEEEADGRYPVKRHMAPENSPYKGAKETFKHGCRFGYFHAAQDNKLLKKQIDGLLETGSSELSQKQIQQLEQENKLLKEQMASTVFDLQCAATDKLELEKENKLLKEQVEKLKELERSFYMNICRAYNAGKQAMNNQHEDVRNGKPFDMRFVGSCEYFKSEFPTFKTNVP